MIFLVFLKNSVHKLLWVNGLFQSGKEIVVLERQGTMAVAVREFVLDFPYIYLLLFTALFYLHYLLLRFILLYQSIYLKSEKS